MAAGSAAVLSSFVLNLIIAVCVFTAFSLVRAQPWCRRFFASRRFAKDLDLKPKRLPNALLSWIYPILTYKEEDIIDEAGLDCAIYLRILRFGAYLFAVLSFACIVIVLPANLTSGEIDRLLSVQGANNGTVVNGRQYRFTDFDHYSLSNVEARSHKMWAHLVAIHFVVLFTLWLLERFNRESVLLRLMFLGNGKRGGPSHTVLVTDIPAISKEAAKGAKESVNGEKEGKKNSGQEHDVESQVAMIALRPASGSKAKITSVVPLSTSPAPSSGSETMPKRAIVPPSRPSETAARTGSATAPRGAGVSFSDVYSFSTQARTASLAETSKPSQRPPAGRPAGVAAPPAGVGEATEAAGPTEPCDSVAGPLVGDDNGGVAPPLVAQPRVGLSAEEMLRQLEAVEADDGELCARPEWDIDIQVESQPADRRLNKRFNYNLSDRSLDATHQAKQALRSGLAPEQLVATEFAMMYGTTSLAAVNLILDTGGLEPLADEYRKLREALEDYLDMLQLRLRLRRGMPHKKLTVLGAKYGQWGREHLGTVWFKKVDAVGFWLDRLKFLRERILDEQRLAAHRVSPSAFITFNTRMSQAVGANSLHHHDINTWRVQNAPAPFEVVWKNLGMTTPEKSGRLYILWAAFWAMTLFFMVPVTIIQALIEVPKLAKIPVLGKIVTAPGIRQILEAIVPGLALKIFLAIVPIVLRYMALFSGTTSLSEIDFGVVQRYFLFQVIVVFFGNIIAGSFFNQLNQWIKSPTSVFSTLGKSIPMTSTFFITYLLTNGLGVKSIAFIRLPGFVIFWILSKFAGSPRARQRLWMYQYTDNGTTVVDHTVTILIGLTFSCINPIVCPAALGYFLVTFLGETYNNIYVFRRAYESAGKLWRTVYNQVMAGLYVMQLTMLGLLGIKAFAYTVLAIPLLLFTVACHLGTLNLYRRPWTVTALHDAAELDMWEADRRRTEAFEEAKRERRRMARLAAAAEAAPQASSRASAASPAAMGPAERRLRAMLREEGAALALTPEEQAEVSLLYKNPSFKLPLDDLEQLEVLARDLLPRLDVLNEWTARLKKQGKKPAPAPAAQAASGATASGGDDASPPRTRKGGREHAEEGALEPPPPELTKYDSKPAVDGDDDEAEL